MGRDITNPLLPTNLTALSGTAFLSKLLSTLLAIGIISGGLIFLFMLVLGAIGWITSGSDKGKLESARSRIVNALIGLVLLLSLIAIIKLVEVITGISLLSIDISGLILGGGSSGPPPPDCIPGQPFC